MSHAALPTLRTPRLTLRPLEHSDADAIVDGINNFDVSRWLGTVPYPYRLEDAQKYLAIVRDGGQQVWAIESEAGFIGTISSHEQLGYWLARQGWRKGFGFEAGRAVVHNWFADAKNEDISASHFQGNGRSAGVLRALGFQFLRHTKTHAESLAQEVPATDVILTRKRWEARQGFTLYTPRLTIRPIEDRDAGPFARLTVPEITRMLSGLKTGMSEAEVLADLPRRRWRGLLRFTLVIEHQGQFVGTIRVGAGPTSVGYFLDPALWGQGLMTEALTAVLPELFDRFPISAIHADHFEDNPASGAVLRKLGFSKTRQSLAKSVARVEPGVLITYALKRDNLRVQA